MAKTRKPSAARKPPVPSDSHSDIDDWIRRVMPDLHPIVKQLDDLVRDTIPRLQYAVKWKKAYYGAPELRTLGNSSPTMIQARRLGVRTCGW